MAAHSACATAPASNADRVSTNRCTMATYSLQAFTCCQRVVGGWGVVRAAGHVMNLDEGVGGLGGGKGCPMEGNNCDNI